MSMGVSTHKMQAPHGEICCGSPSCFDADDPTDAKGVLEKLIT